MAIASLVLAILKGAEWGWSNARVLGAFVASLLLGGYFALRATRERNRSIDPVAAADPRLRLSNGATLLMASGFFAYTLCNVLFLTRSGATRFCRPAWR